MPGCAASAGSSLDAHCPSSSPTPSSSQTRRCATSTTTASRRSLARNLTVPSCVLQVSLNGIEEYSRGVRSFYKQGSAVGEVVCTVATAPDTITVVWRNYGTVNLGPGVELAPYLVTTTLKTSASDGGLIVKQEDAFDAPDKLGLLSYNLFKSKRPEVPPIGSVACPLPKKA